MGPAAYKRRTQTLRFEKSFVAAARKEVAERAYFLGGWRRTDDDDRWARVIVHHVNESRLDTWRAELIALQEKFKNGKPLQARVGDSDQLLPQLARVHGLSSLAEADQFVVERFRYLMSVLGESLQFAGRFGSYPISVFIILNF
jgi:hypothetical protein